MNIERDKFLTEAMGLCYHDYVEVHGTDSWDERSACDTLDFKCSKCGDYQECVKFRDHTGWAVKNENYYDFGSWCFIDFDTWSGFGDLWDWSHTQEWWSDFEDLEDHNPNYYDDSNSYNFHWIDQKVINPERFANAVYEFLKDRK